MGALPVYQQVKPFYGYVKKYYILHIICSLYYITQFNYLLYKAQKCGIILMLNKETHIIERTAAYTPSIKQILSHYTVFVL